MDMFVFQIVHTRSVCGWSKIQNRSDVTDLNKSLSFFNESIEIKIIAHLIAGVMSLLALLN